MKQKKTKVFLGAFVNYTNAQNLNCLALAKYLDKSKYEVRTGIGYSGNLPVEKLDGVRYLKAHYPAKIWFPITFIRGLFWCDIAYLPTPCCWRLCVWLLKLFRKPAFKTVEGIIVGFAFDRAIEKEGTVEEVRRSLLYTGHTYSITESMKAVNEAAIGIKTEEKVLYLGVTASGFANDIKRTQLTDALLIGADLERKGLPDYLAIAKQFPGIRFHIVGGGVGNLDAQTEVNRLGLTNVTCHGSLSHAALAELLKTIQLHIFPSRAEGFPKVTLECAAAGVPSLVYDDYGADEWITTSKDGFVVKTLDEMAAVVQSLLDHPDRLPALADGARALAQRFEWSTLVRDWEAVIDTLAKK